MMSESNGLRLSGTTRLGGLTSALSDRHFFRLYHGFRGSKKYLNNNTMMKTTELISHLEKHLQSPSPYNRNPIVSDKLMGWAIIKIKQAQDLLSTSPDLSIPQNFVDT